MKSHGKKMIAPIVVTLIFILYFIIYFVFLFTVLEGIWKYLFGLIPLALAIVTISVCIERIKEINKGEEDDLSKY